MTATALIWELYPSLISRLGSQSIQTSLLRESK